MKRVVACAGMVPVMTSAAGLPGPPTFAPGCPPGSPVTFPGGLPQGQPFIMVPAGAQPPQVGTCFLQGM